MEMSVQDVAQSIGVSRRRVLQLISDGSMPATKIGRVYVVDERELDRPRYRSRPLSPTMAWSLIALLSGDEPQGLQATQRSRLQRYVGRLRADDDASGLLASWVRSRAQRLQYSAQPGTPDRLRADSRLTLSGISDPRSGLSAGHQVEGYLSPAVVDAVCRDHLLLPARQGNVIVHVTTRQLAPPVPLGLVAADLADFGTPRESGRVAQLLAECLS